MSPRNLIAWALFKEKEDEMVQFILRRLLQTIPMLIGITILLFLVFSLMPADFIDLQYANVRISEERLEAIKEKHGLNDPLPIRYVRWVTNMLRGDFGDSSQFKKPVTEVMNDYIWNSFRLAVVAQFLAILIAVPIGIYSAINQYSFFDMFFTVFALMGISIPAFFFGLLLQKVISVDMGWLPLSGMRTAGSTLTGFAAFIDLVRHMILPLTVLTLISVGGLMRYTRTSMLEVIRQDYIRTARAKGLSENKVIYKHAFRNAMIPLITLLGFMLPGLFAGAMLTETIFAWPGIGRVALQSIFQRDYFFLMAFNVLMAVLTLLGNLIADILYAAADPRIRLQ